VKKQSTLHISANLVFHQRTKHLYVNCHLVREKLQAGTMRLLPVSYHNQTTDVFTEVEGPRQFHECITKFGTRDVYKPPACEGVVTNTRDEKEEI